MNTWLLAQDGVWLYIGLFLLLVGGALGLPVPEDIPLVLAGYLIHEQRVNPELTFLVCYAGALLGDIFIYAVGRKLGMSIAKRSWFKLRFGEDGLNIAKQSLERRSITAIFIARHLFYLRTLTFLTCGAVKMSFARFLIADAIAALVSVPLMLFLGYFFGEHIEALLAYVSKAKGALLVLGILIVLSAVFYLLKKAKHAGDSE